MSDLSERCANYEEILRCVCHHLELPQSESGPADDLRLYDRALEAADLYTRDADAELAKNTRLRFAAEADAFRLRKALGDVVAAIGDWSRPTGANGMTSPSREHPLMLAAEKSRAALKDAKERKE